MELVQSHVTQIPLDLRGATLGNMNLKTEFQRFAEASWPPGRTVVVFPFGLEI